MNKHYQSAAQRLHEFAAEAADCTEAELRAELTAHGGNVEAFLARLGHEAGIKAETLPAKKPSAAEQLRALASQAGSKVKDLLGDMNPDEAGLPAAAYGRTGRRDKGARTSPRGRHRGQSNK